MAFNLKSAPLNSGVRVLKCGSCGRTYRPLDIDGEGRNGVLIVLEQPSARQSETLTWFSGNPTIFSTLVRQGYDVEQEFWVTGLFACKGASKNYECCLAKLESTIKKLQPRLITVDILVWDTNRHNMLVDLFLLCEKMICLAVGLHR